MDWQGRGGGGEQQGLAEREWCKAGQQSSRLTEPRFYPAQRLCLNPLATGGANCSSSSLTLTPLQAPVPRGQGCLVYSHDTGLRRNHVPQPRATPRCGKAHSARHGQPPPPIITAYHEFKQTPSADRPSAKPWGTSGPTPCEQVETKRPGPLLLFLFFGGGWVRGREQTGHKHKDNWKQC